MGIWLGAWAGDHAGTVEGRQPNRLLFSLTHTDATFPSGIHQKGDLYGTTWYFNMYVTCLTPGTREAVAIAVDDIGDYVWSVEVAEMDWGGNKDPWKPGIHLFSVMLLANGGHQSGAIATVIIDDNVKRLDTKRDPIHEWWRHDWRFKNP